MFACFARRQVADEFAVTTEDKDSLHSGNAASGNKPSVANVLPPSSDSASSSRSLHLNGKGADHSDPLTDRAKAAAASASDAMDFAIGGNQVSAADSRDERLQCDVFLLYFV